MSMKTITLIRHGQSIFNAGQYKIGDNIRDCRLTDTGIKQASKLTNSFDLLIVSPLKRALETYLNSNISTKKIVVSSLFKEHHDNNIINYLNGEKQFIETHEETQLRAKEAVEFVKAQKEENIGIISHGVFMGYFMEACGYPIKKSQNCETFTIILFPHTS